MFYGKGEIKKLKVSPDSLMQLALQLAFYRIHKEVPKTYETAMTRLEIHYFLTFFLLISLHEYL